MLTPEAIKLFRAPPSDLNPFVKLGRGKVMLRADKFEISPRWVGARFAGYFVRYWWRQVLVSVDKFDTDNKEQPVEINGVELRYTLDLRSMGINLS